VKTFHPKHGGNILHRNPCICQQITELYTLKDPGRGEGLLGAVEPLMVVVVVVVVVSHNTSILILTVVSNLNVIVTVALIRRINTAHHFVISSWYTFN
jgi:hypothetical protein